jgi:hypothetical protein
MPELGRDMPELGRDKPELGRDMRELGRDTPALGRADREGMLRLMDGLRPDEKLERDMDARPPPPKLRPPPPKLRPPPPRGPRAKVSAPTTITTSEATANMKDNLFIIGLLFGCR